MRQECHFKVEDVLFERQGLQGRLDLTAPQIFGARNSRTAARDRLDNILDVRTADICGWSCCLHAFFGYIHKVARSVIEEAAAYRAELTDVRRFSAREPENDLTIHC